MSFDYLENFSDDCFSENSQQADSMDELITSHASYESDDNYTQATYCVDHFDYDTEESQEADSCFSTFWCTPKSDIDDDNYSTTALMCQEYNDCYNQESDSLYIDNFIKYKTSVIDDDNSSTKAFDDE